MKIAADGSHLMWPGGGVARVLDGMLHGLERAMAPGDELTIYYNAFRRPKRFGARVRERWLRVPRATLWNQVRVPLALLRDRPDVYLGGAYITPVVSPVPTLVLVHDCLAFRDPAAKPGVEGRYLRFWMKASAHSATTVAAVSKWAAGETEKYLGVPRDRVPVVYSGVDDRFSPSAPPTAASDADDLRRRLGIAGDYCLQVGAYERHKGGATAVEAVRRVRQSGRRLELVRCGIQGEPVSRDHEAHVVDLGWVDDETLVGLYRHADVVCVSSTHEGFGLPLLEAMACGTPVIAGDVPGLREAAGDAAVLVPAGDAEALAGALEALLASPAEQDRLRRAGLTWSGRFTWETNAEAMLEVLRGTVDNRRASSTNSGGIGSA